MRGKRSDTGSTAVWLLSNHFSPEDEEQAAGLEKADLVQPADLQEAQKALPCGWAQRPKAEKATGREGCGSKKEEVRVSTLR